MNWETLLCLGDSITFGARSYLGYPEVCGNILQKNLGNNWNVINHAANGNTAIDLIRSLDKNWNNLKENFPGILTILIGTNDIKIKTPEEDFLIAYNLLVVKSRLLAINNNIILLKIPEFTNKVFYPYNFQMNENVKSFNALIESIAHEHNLRLLGLELKNDDYFDGVHLNNKGCMNAGNQLAEFILKDKGIESSSALS